MRGLRVGQFGQTLGDPFFFAARRFRIIAALNADAERIGQARAGLEKVGGFGVDFGVALIPEDVAALRIQKHDAFRKRVHGGAQPIDRPLGRRVRNIEGRLGGSPASLQAGKGFRR